tara:strand:+ start:1927 stop:2145 length:219 start_codon:yes stop_codon:yes gene_type:complete
MRFLSKLRLFLAAMLLILGILVTHAKESKYELDRKLIYQEIHFKLEKGIITLEEAQKMWLKKVKQLKKEEAK